MTLEGSIMGPADMWKKRGLRSTSSMDPQRRRSVNRPRRVQDGFNLFIQSNGQPPENVRELNNFLDSYYPDFDRIGSREFSSAMNIFENKVTEEMQKRDVGKRAAGQKRLTAFKKEERSINTRLKKEMDEVREEEQKKWGDRLVGDEAAEYDKSSPEERRKRFKPFFDTIRKRILDEDPAYNMLKKEMAKIKADIDSPRPTRPKKERPSGGGSLTVEEDMPGAKAGTIITTKGPWQGAKQYKFEPTDDGRYKVYRRNTGEVKKGELPSMTPEWEEGREITADELYARSEGKFGAKAKKEKPVARGPEPRMEYDRALEDMPEPEITQRGLAPQGIEDYSGVRDFPINEEDDYGMRDGFLDEEEDREPYGLARYPRNVPYDWYDIPGY